MARIEITEPVAKCLHDGIVQKFERETDDPPSSQDRKYGFNKSPSGPSILTAIHDKVRSVYQGKRATAYVDHLLAGYNAKHLYDLVNLRYTSHTVTGVDERYVHCYLLYLCEDVSFFQEDFVQNLDRIFSLVLQPFIKKGELTSEQFEEQLGLIRKGRRKAPSKASLYRCSYFGSEDKEVKTFLAEIYPDNNRIEIQRTPLGHSFAGEIKPNYPVVTSITMENTDKHNRRIVHMILTNGNIPFYDRELSLGVYISVDNDTRPSGGAIAFEKLADDFNPDDLENVPHAIRFFLRRHAYTMAETDVSTLTQLDKAMLEKFPAMKSFAQEMKKLAGIYRCYAISRDQRLLLVYFNILKNGKVEFKRSNHTTYFGELTLHHPALAIIRTETANRQSKYHTVLQIPEFGSYNFFKAVYAGIDSYSHPKAGRCLFEKLPPETVFDELEPIEVKLGEAEHRQILEAFPEFNQFFSSEGDDLFIENGKKLGRDDLYDIEFPKGSKEKLPLIEGDYTYLRTSTFDGNMIKEYPISIDEDGYVAVAGNFLSKGKAHIYDDLVFMHLFHNETRFSEKPKADSLGIPKYDGLAIFKIPPGKKQPEYLSGVYISTNYDQYPVCGRIVLKRSEESFNRLSPKVFKSYQKDFQWLNDQTNNLGQFLTGQYDNFIKLTQRQVGDATRKTFQRDFELAEHLFFSACYLAGRGKKKDALKALQKAFEHGFEDEAMFARELKESFSQFEKEARNLWDRRTELND